jgi:hypothetical protein
MDDGGDPWRNLAASVLLQALADLKRRYPVSWHAWQFIASDDDALIDAARSVAQDIAAGKLPSQMDAALTTLGNGIAAWVTRVAKGQVSDG